MSRVYYSAETEALATFWRIHRRDGLTLGFTSHDRDLWFDGIVHRAAPGMVPSAVRRSAGLDADLADVEGVLSHDAIAAPDLAEGRFDGASVVIGVVDWENLDHAALYRGTIGTVSDEGQAFTAQLRSAKALLDSAPVPRTSPTCRALFCGPGCTLPAARYTHDIRVASTHPAHNRVNLTGGPGAEALTDGWLRWLDGPHAGLTMLIVESDAGGIMLDAPLSPAVQPGMRVSVREGCDHTIRTCADRFGNAVNFQGEPFLPGNDLMVRSAQAPA